MSNDSIGPNTNESPPQQARGGSKGPSPSLIAFLVLAAIAIIFILQNRNPARTHLLFFTFNSRVWTAIGVAIIVGAGLDRLFSIWWRRRRSRKS